MPAIRHCAPWQHLQSFEQGFGLGPAMGIDPAHDDVYALLTAGLGGLEHGVGFAYASRGTEENFELAAALLRLFLLHAGQQGIGIGSCSSCIRISVAILFSIIEGEVQREDVHTWFAQQPQGAALACAAPPTGVPHPHSAHVPAQPVPT